MDPYRDSTIVEPLRIGDTVELKSGGPAMTVVGVDANGILCTWFDLGYKDMIEGTEYGDWHGPFKSTFPHAAVVRIDLEDAE